MIDKEIVLKAWEVYQGLVPGLGETCWKIRSIFYTTSSAVIGYGFVHSISFLYIVAAMLAIVFFILEAGYKQIQNQYIAKSAEIERTLNDLLANEQYPFIPERGIKTVIKTPTRRGYLKLLRWRTFLFWGPYLLVLICTLLLAWTGAGMKQPSNESQDKIHSDTR